MTVLVEVFQFRGVEHGEHIVVAEKVQRDSGMSWVGCRYGVGTVKARHK